MNRQQYRNPKPDPFDAVGLAAIRCIALADDFAAARDGAEQIAGRVASILARPDPEGRADLSKRIAAVGSALAVIAGDLGDLAEATNSVCLDLTYGTEPDKADYTLLPEAVLAHTKKRAATAQPLRDLPKVKPVATPLAVLGNGEYATVIGGAP